jgi:hypothetical protein
MIYNHLGQQVYEKDIHNNEIGLNFTIDIYSLDKGLFIVML